MRHNVSYSKPFLGDTFVVNLKFILMVVIIFLIWIPLCFAVASMGSDKKIGWTSSFLISLFFSPIIGLLFVIASSPKPKSKRSNSKVVGLNKRAAKINKNGDFEEALSLLKEALILDGSEPQTHYNVAVVYSSLRNEKSAFYHLEKAIELGYKYPITIAKGEHLKWLREQKEFNGFVDRGFKIAPKKEVEQNTNYLNQLKELGNLRDSGILTEQEFLTKKKEVLEMSV